MTYHDLEFYPCMTYHDGLGLLLNMINHDLDNNLITNNYIDLSPEVSITTLSPNLYFFTLYVFKLYLRFSIYSGADMQQKWLNCALFDKSITLCGIPEIVRPHMFQKSRLNSYILNV